MIGTLPLDVGYKARILSFIIMMDPMYMEYYTIKEVKAIVTILRKQVNMPRLVTLLEKAPMLFTILLSTKRPKTVAA